MALPPGRCHAAGTGRFQELKVSSAPAVFQNLAELPLENWDGFLAECFYLISLQIKKRSNRRHMFSISFTCVLLCLKERGMKCLASVFSISVQTTAGAHHYYSIIFREWGLWPLSISCHLIFFRKRAAV